MEDEVRRRLQAAIKDAGTLSAYATRIGIKVQALGQMRSELAAPSAKLLSALGFDETHPDWPGRKTRLMSPTPSVRWDKGNLSLAAQMLAQGRPFDEVARRFGVAPKGLTSAIKRNQDLWTDLKARADQQYAGAAN